MKLSLKLIFLLTVVSFVFPLKAFADTSCQPIYGGGQTCVTSENILINKKVLNPSTNIFVENLGINDPKYSPGFIVNFRLEVTNNGDTNLAKVDVKDIFPKLVEFGSGPGNFDQKTKTLTFAMDNLAPNETRIFGIVGKVVAANQLPSSQSIVCVVNQAIATTGDNDNSQDNTQLCIENKIPAPVVTTKKGFPVLSPVPVYTTPATGSEALALFSLIPTGIAGWFLRKYALKNERKLN